MCLVAAVQVLAMFANSKVTWPPLIKTVLAYLSVFNFNLDLTAPEVPTTRFAIALLLLPPPTPGARQSLVARPHLPFTSCVHFRTCAPPPS